MNSLRVWRLKIAVPSIQIYDWKYSRKVQKSHHRSSVVQFHNLINEGEKIQTKSSKEEKIIHSDYKQTMISLKKLRCYFWFDEFHHFLFDKIRCNHITAKKKKKKIELFNFKCEFKLNIVLGWLIDYETFRMIQKWINSLFVHVMKLKNVKTMLQKLKKKKIYTAWKSQALLKNQQVCLSEKENSKMFHLEHYHSWIDNIVYIYTFVMVCKRRRSLINSVLLLTSTLFELILLSFVQFILFPFDLINAKSCSHIQQFTRNFAHLYIF